MRKLKKITLGLALGFGLGFAAAGSAQAGVVATQAFVDFGVPSANTGNINTATSFTIGDLVSNIAHTGFLIGMPSQDFGSVTFSLSQPLSLDFGDAVFGSFASTSITETVNHAGTIFIVVDGNWMPGTYGGVADGSYLSSFSIAFTQTPPYNGVISNSATFSVPPATVPEPSTLVMMLAGFAVIGLFGRRALKPADAAFA